MMSITQAITTALLQFIWQGILLAAIVWWVLALLRRRSPELRYAVGCVAMTIMVLLPAVTAYRAYVTPIPSVAGSPTASSAESAAVAGGDAKPLSLSWPAYLRLYALPIWIAGVLLCSLRLIWCGRQITALRLSGKTAADSIVETVRRLVQRTGVSRQVAVLVSQLVEGPSVVGWIRPVILIPAASLSGLTPEQLETVLAHEVAHIRRYDDLVNMVQALVETLLFYHPAVWWLSARIRQERELCCDDLAIQVTGNSLGYARALARLERMRLSPSAMALGAADGSLGYRIRRIVGEAAPESSAAKMPGVIALCVCLGLTAIALNSRGMQGQSQESQGPQPAIAKLVLAPQAGGVFQLQPLEGRLSLIRDARGVTVDSGAANIVHRSSVEYPQAARANGIEGTVTLEVTLDDSGSVTDARVLAGPIELRRACLQSVLQWHFAPEAANSTRQIAIRFDSKASQSPDPKEDELVAAKRKAEERVLATRGATDQSNVQNLERELNNLRAQPQSQPIETEMANLKRQIELLRLSQTRVIFSKLQGSVAGRVLTGISFSGVSESTQKSLLANLPVKVQVGDTLTEGAIAKFAAALRSYDEHLVATFEPSGDTEATLNISVRQ
jgi:TonB family protein